MHRRRNIIALIVNGFIAISTFIITVKGISFGASSGQVGENMIGIGYFKPYTIDTNVINGIMALMIIPFNINNLIENKDELPRFLVVGQLIATVGVAVTILTVVFFLAPTNYIGHMGVAWLFSNDMFFFHLVNPILSILNFVLLDKRYLLNKKEICLGISTTVIYSFVYLYNVMLAKNWSDFYGFTFGGNLYIGLVSMVVMYLVTLLISFVLVKLNGKSSKKSNGKYN